MLTHILLGLMLFVATLTLAIPAAKKDTAWQDRTDAHWMASRDALKNIAPAQQLQKQIGLPQRPQQKITMPGKAVDKLLPQQGKKSKRDICDDWCLEDEWHPVCDRIDGRVFYNQCYAQCYGSMIYDLCYGMY